MTLALSQWWYVGWGVGLVVVLIAAALLITIITLGRRVAGQARDITAALDGARENTLPLWDVRETNAKIARITSGLAAARGLLSR